MTGVELLGLVALGALAWLAWSSLKAREAANVAIRRVCAEHALFFLDDTVGLESLRPVRDHDGHLKLRRVYGFDYSDTGNNRRRGSVTVIGEVVAEISVSVPVPGEGMLH